MTTAVMDDDGGVDGRRMRRETRVTARLKKKAPRRRALLSIQGWQVRQVGETLIKRRVR
jgi:hypothetical protein